MRTKIMGIDGFRMVFPNPQCTNLCFWYIPKCLRGQEETKEWWQRLGKVNNVQNTSESRLCSFLKNDFKKNLHKEPFHNVKGPYQMDVKRHIVVSIISKKYIFL